MCLILLGTICITNLANVPALEYQVIGLLSK